MVHIIKKTPVINRRAETRSIHMEKVKWQRPRYMPCFPLGDHQSRITECEKHIRLSRKAAADGAVLLKNDRRLLPFGTDTKVAIFGKAQIDYVKGGGGSGNTVVSYVRDIYQGLKTKKKHIRIFEPLSFYYQRYVEEQYGLGGKNGMLEEPPIPQELLEEAKAFTDTAIITICRYSTETEDRKNDGTDHYYYLSEGEKQMVDAVTACFSNVVVLLNVGAMIDTLWFADNPKITSALMLWQGGMEGGLAAADLLVGEVTPSGKLVDTCAASFDDYPSSENFHESDDYVKYTEDIFVGYRYFETVPGKKERVVYPFGYGLSYTDFSVTGVDVYHNSSRVFVTFTVTNTGSYPGREVVQLYYGAPQGKLSKPAKQLCGFAKTKLLSPGEQEELCISFAIRDMASFDDQGLVAKSCFVMESGAYRFYLGTSVQNAKELEDAYFLSDTIITERLHSYCAPERLDKRMNADGTYVALECGEVSRAVFPCAYTFAEAPVREKPYTLLAAAKGKIDVDTFIAQLTDEELCHLVSGQPGFGISSTSGMGHLLKYEIPLFMTADGPAGLRSRTSSKIPATAFPVATALACTWDLALIEEIGQAGALEVKENNICMWLTPALNIHRSPLCGRNFEYFSEDPFLTGKMAAAKVKGIQSQNIVACPKHFAANNKETNRRYCDSIVSERALREIYLKGFEICVKEAHPKMIMTAYNPINGVHASENAELLCGILRQEWGFDGMVTSDWVNEKDHIKEIKAGNDIKMPRGEPEKLMGALADGTLKREELAICVRRILEMFLWLE